MILGQSSPQYLAALANAGRSTPDDVLRRIAARRPDALALVDPVNRRDVTGGPPRRLTYAQADRMVSAIAGRLRRLGLQTDEVVGVQMANTVDTVVTLLGIWRAGLIAAPLPLLRQQTECVAALTRAGAKALITSARVGAVDHCAAAMSVAAEIFNLRHVCAFGQDVPDGVVRLDDLYDADRLDPLPALERAINPAAHVAVITFDGGADALVPVARNHLELLAASAAVALEGRIEQGSTILSTLAMPSFGGLALTALPWLIVGGTLALHHPFDAEAFAQQWEEVQAGVVVVPGPLAHRLATDEFLARRQHSKAVIAGWRAPEQLATSPTWSDPAVGLIDVPIFGETALLALKRGIDGVPAAVGLGAITAPRHAPSAVRAADVACTESGTLAIRGPMVPKFAFQGGGSVEGAPVLVIGKDGFVDTGYGCTVDQATQTVTVTRAAKIEAGADLHRAALRALRDGAARAQFANAAFAPSHGGDERHSADDPSSRDLIARELDRLGAEAFGVPGLRQQTAA
jgi:hypothetical protein